MMVFHIDKSIPDRWGHQFTGCMFKVLSIRQYSVIVKCNMDEGFQPPLNTHEFPTEIGTIKNIIDDKL